tara:strand:+ start:7840 stop:8373 length:534 start_codon:yes stop_codon:yes gene_type:complete
MMLVTQQIYNGFQNSNEKLPYWNLLLAGMFHDMNHTMGGETDEINVKLACMALKDWWKYSGSKIDISFMEVDINEIINIIKATQYPYVINDEDLTRPQQLIRDCDLLIVMQSNWFQNLLGLNDEMSVNDINLVLSKSIDFYNNVTMRTDWAKEIHEKEWPIFMDRLENYSELFNGDL